MPKEGIEPHIGHLAYVIHHINLADIVTLLQLCIYTSHSGFFFLLCKLGTHNQLKCMMVGGTFKYTWIQ